MNRNIVEDLAALKRDIELRSDHAPGEWCNGFDTASRVYGDAVEKLLRKHIDLALSRGMIDNEYASTLLQRDERQLSFNSLGFEVVDGMPDGVAILSNGRGQHVIVKVTS